MRYIYIDIKLWKERAWGKERKRLGSEGGKEKWGWKVKEDEVTCMLQVVSLTCYTWHTSWCYLLQMTYLFITGFWGCVFIVTWHKGFVIVTCSQNGFRFEDVFEPKNVFFLMGFNSVEGTGSWEWVGSLHFFWFSSFFLNSDNCLYCCLLGS